MAYGAAEELRVVGGEHGVAALLVLLKRVLAAVLLGPCLLGAECVGGLGARQFVGGDDELTSGEQRVPGLRSKLEEMADDGLVASEAAVRA